MRTKVVVAFVALAAAVALTGPAALAQSATDSQQYGDDVYGSADQNAAPSQSASNTGSADSATLAKKTAPAQTVLSANLTGPVEVPAGDPDATGSTEVKVSSGQVCWKVSWSGISPTASHIHKGAKGAAGPIVVPFFKSDTPISGSSKQGCTEVSADLAKAIAANPGAYYVNVHDAQFPKGAIRAQLALSGTEAGVLPNTGSFRSKGLMLLGLSIVTAGSLLLAVGQRRRRPSHARR